MFNKKTAKKVRLQDMTSAEYSGARNLQQVEIGLSNYNNYLVSIFASEIRNTGAKVLDFGAGAGALADNFRKNFSIVPDCVEIDPNLQLVLSNRNFVVFNNLDKINSFYDFIYTSNVLEHIPDDLQTVKKLSSLLSHGGKILIHVPAFPILYSKLDFNLGHVRRYQKKDLLSLLNGADLVLSKIRYDDFLGFFVVFLLKFSGLMSMLSKETNNDSMALKIYDSFIFPLSRILDRIGFSRVLGKNLILLAVKKNH
jgi:2-polyprenyl-3-methyl-5-hydroxy-6-metoxy-1,4-benzoquinol methylase